MDLTVRNTTYGADDQTWLASAHGTDSADSVKITITGTEVTTYGTVLPSGVPLNDDGTVDATGSTAASGNKKEVEGFLLAPIDISRGAGTYSGAMIRHGQINDAARVAKGLVALTAAQKTSIAAYSQILVVA